MTLSRPPHASVSFPKTHAVAEAFAEQVSQGSRKPSRGVESLMLGWTGIDWARFVHTENVGFAPIVWGLGSAVSGADYVQYPEEHTADVKGEDSGHG